MCLSLVSNLGKACVDAWNWVGSSGGRFRLDAARAVDEFGQVVVFHPVNPFTVSVDPVS